ncbi:Class I glutamine amidotransferase-like protein [Klebsormidium nitens]|uniref:folate gamma-glutamyl hydrolase n=1 Tax=Klebsormidium nitens TaxID=105231 RepID=A0A1Y1I0X1_KLENI|nr:Class I glutamine amidotransferase-like protein [Klebsormidium nitens]|eukprot:GAQ81738.1 Class I glutamine amidotransferase-like protein [Klebsormidium nitens]
MSGHKSIGVVSANCSVPNSADDSADDENAGFDGDDDDDVSLKPARRMGVQGNEKLAPEDESEDDSWRVEGTDWQGDLGRSVDLPWPGHHKHRHLLIGVLTQPYYSWNMTKPDAEHTGLDKLFIGASYVRLLEAGGAQVVPVFHDSTDEEFEKVMSQINMLVIPGGFASLKKSSEFYQAGKKLLDIAMRLNDDGDFFAVHGICLGMELMLKAVSAKHKILRRVNATAAPATLFFPYRSARRKAMFAWLSDELIERIKQVPVAMENHHFGLNPDRFDENEDISNFYEMLTTSPDKEGTHYVSTIQATSYPFTGTQWHPEKSAYEWYSTYHVPHSLDAIQLMQATANFIVSQARRNDHRLPCWDDERKLLIYNYPLLFGSRQRHSVYDQYYIVPARAERQALAQGEQAATI